MRAAILSAGPSGANTWPWAAAGYDVRLAVNGAIVPAWAHPIDWWCAGDTVSLKIFTPHQPPRAGIVTMNDNRARLTSGDLRHLTTPAMQVVTWDELPKIDFGKRDWSLTTAIQHAHGLGATHIDCYGLDWSGDLDAAGHRNSERHPERWAREQDEFRRISLALARLGTTVHRIAPEEHHDGT